MLRGNENPENAKISVTNVMCDYCAWISEILARISAETRIRKKKKKRVDPVVVVHGGAGRIPRYAQKFMLDEVKNAAVAAYRDLIKGRCSLDAVERAICHMESKKYFNCGYGGSLDANGEVVMDAAIMTNGLRAGCVGAVRNIAHPITLAKIVLQQAGLVLIVEAGAQKFALESGVPTLSPGQLIVTSDSKTSLHEEEINDFNRDTDEEAQDIEKTQELLQDGDKPSGKKECIPECVIERYGDKEEAGAIFEVARLDEFLEVEPDFIQVG
ncbi:isoaspartyl peptidase/L-asparaginase [Temnothorax americanus]|uniref:isoaspartyl peptidase/L-asparaginase n=1 Tax=Temnothorax americanus TaxID=1964332 RepID=UPI004068D7F6